MTPELQRRSTLSVAMTWLAGLVVFAELGLVILLPAASQTPPAGPFAAIEGSGRVALGLALALVVPYAFGRLVSRHTSRPFILLLSGLLAFVGAGLVLAVGDYLDPFVHAPHFIGGIATPILIGASLEYHGIEFFERPDSGPYGPGEGPGFGGSGGDEDGGLPNPLLLVIAVPFIAAMIFHAIANGIPPGGPPIQP